MRIAIESFPTGDRNVKELLGSEEKLNAWLEPLEHKIMFELKPGSVVFNTPKNLDEGVNLFIPSANILFSEEFFIVVYPNVADDISPTDEEKCAMLYKMIYEHFCKRFPLYRPDIEITAPVWVGVEGKKLE